MDAAGYSSLLVDHSWTTIQYTDHTPAKMLLLLNQQLRPTRVKFLGGEVSVVNTFGTEGSSMMFPHLVPQHRYFGAVFRVTARGVPAGAAARCRWVWVCGRGYKAEKFQHSS